MKQTNDAYFTKSAPLPEKKVENISFDGYTTIQKMPVEPQNTPKKGVFAQLAELSREQAQRSPQNQAQPNLNERKQEIKKESSQLAMDELNYINQAFRVSTSYRYPSDLLEELENVIDHVRRKFKNKLKKNDILILALANLLIDYKKNEEKSVLHRVLIAKK